MDPQLSRLDSYLEGKKFHLGDYLTLSDIYFYETYQVMKLIHLEKSHSYKNISRVEANIEAEEWMVNFKKSDKYFERTFSGPNAHINN